jgi:hypothetical protein
MKKARPNARTRFARKRQQQLLAIFPVESEAKSGKPQEGVDDGKGALFAGDFGDAFYGLDCAKAFELFDSSRVNQVDWTCGKDDMLAVYYSQFRGQDCTMLVHVSCSTQGWSFRWRVGGSSDYDEASRWHNWGQDVDQSLYDSMRDGLGLVEANKEMRIESPRDKDVGFMYIDDHFGFNTAQYHVQQALARWYHIFICNLYYDRNLSTSNLPKELWCIVAEFASPEEKVPFVGLPPTVLERIDKNAKDPGAYKKMVADAWGRIETLLNHWDLAWESDFCDDNCEGDDDEDDDGYAF